MEPTKFQNRTPAQCAKSSNDKSRTFRDGRLEQRSLHRDDATCSKRECLRFPRNEKSFGLDRPDVRLDSRLPDNSCYRKNTPSGKDCSSPKMDPIQLGELFLRKSVRVKTKLRSKRTSNHKSRLLFGSLIKFYIAISWILIQGPVPVEAGRKPRRLGQWLCALWKMPTSKKIAIAAGVGSLQIPVTDAQDFLIYDYDDLKSTGAFQGKIHTNPTTMTTVQAVSIAMLPVNGRGKGYIKMQGFFGAKFDTQDPEQKRIMRHAELEPTIITDLTRKECPVVKMRTAVVKHDKVLGVDVYGGLILEDGGLTLNRVMNQFDDSAKLWTLFNIVRGIRKIHTIGNVVHNDLYPENLWMFGLEGDLPATSDESVPPAPGSQISELRFGDFDLASSGNKPVDHRAGTLMSPVRFMGRGEACKYALQDEGCRDDVDAFSIGIILADIFTTDHPIDSPTHTSYYRDLQLEIFVNWAPYEKGGGEFKKIYNEKFIENYVDTTIRNGIDDTIVLGKPIFDWVKGLLDFEWKTQIRTLKEMERRCKRETNDELSNIFDFDKAHLEMNEAGQWVAMSKKITRMKKAAAKKAKALREKVYQNYLNKLTKEDPNRSTAFWEKEAKEQFDELYDQGMVENNGDVKTLMEQCVAMHTPDAPWGARAHYKKMRIQEAKKNNETINLDWYDGIWAEYDAHIRSLPDGR